MKVQTEALGGVPREMRGTVCVCLKFKVIFLGRFDVFFHDFLEVCL
jgi:hypothetical protein